MQNFKPVPSQLMSNFHENRQPILYMWGRKCALFPEHLISLPLGSSGFHPFITEFVSIGLCLRINDSGLFAWISPDCFVLNLFDF